MHRDRSSQKEIIPFLLLSCSLLKAESLWTDRDEASQGVGQQRIAKDVNNCREEREKKEEKKKKKAGDQASERASERARDGLLSKRRRIVP